MIRRMLSALACAAALSGVAAAGCGPSSTSLCDASCDCRGCSNAQYDDCVDGIEDGARAADREDCVDEYDEYLACLDDTGECKGDDYKTDCKREHDDYRKCVD